MTYPTLSSSQVEALLQEPGWTLDPELTARFETEFKAKLPQDDSQITCTVYINPDGRVLSVSDDGRGKVVTREVWLSEFESWVSRLEAVLAEGYPQSYYFLEGLLPQGQDFINQVPELIDQLAVQLNIPRQELNYSNKSLLIVDRAVCRKGADKCLAADIFAPLVAYGGEVLRQRTGGHWELRLVPEDENLPPKIEIWEPWIVDAAGRDLAFVSSLYDDLAEAPVCSFYAVVSGWILKQPSRLP